MANYKYAKMICGGQVFPICPCRWCWDGDFMDHGSYIIFRNNGTYYLAHTANYSYIMFYVDKETGTIRCDMGCDRWELVDGSWANKQSFGIGVEFGSFSDADFIWTNMSKLLYSNGSVSKGDTGIRGSDPVLFSSDNFTLEPLPGPVVEVSGWGNTGIIVGAQIRENTTGQVYDISASAQYNLASIAAAYGYFDGSRQLIVDPAAPFGSLGIEITWDELPGQTAIISVWWPANGGGGSGDSGGTGGGTGGGEGGDTTTSLITNIELHIFPDEVIPGGYAVANVIVSGTGDYSRDFTVEISESNSLKTCFAKGISYHNVFVGEDETAEYILVTARSIQDPSMSATEMLYINHSGTDDGSNDAEQLRRAFFAGLSSGAATSCQGESQDSDLPTGYKRLDYIETTGTQYIDTGFIPNQDTRIVCEFMYLGGDGIFGSRYTTASRNFNLRTIIGKWQSGYAAKLGSFNIVADSNWHVADLNKNESYIDGVLGYAHEYVSFTAPETVSLGGINANNKFYYGLGRYRTCQIYDNGTLVRDLIPCKDVYGNIGMYDKQNKVFYGNAGSGTLVAGHL